MIFYCTSTSSTTKPAWIDNLKKLIPTTSALVDVGSVLPATLFEDFPEIDPKLTIDQCALLNLDPTLLLTRAEAMKHLEYGELGIYAKYMAFRDLYWLIRSDYVFADFSQAGFGQALFDITIANTCRIPIIAINSRTQLLSHVVNCAFAVITPENLKNFVVQLLINKR